MNTNKSNPILCKLVDCITDKDMIKSYLTKNKNLANKQEADYCLFASSTHLLYKYETESGVWYVHYGPEEIFKICVYKKEF